MTGDRNSPISRAKTLQHVLSILNEFKSADDKNLLLDSLDASKYLTVIQMMRVVRLVFHKAMESPGNAYAMTWLSFLIIEKDGSELVLESLLTCSREWFGQQEADLKRKNKCDEGWAAFVSFLRELYASLQPKKMKTQSGESKQPDLLPSQALKHSQCLANLILDSGIALMDQSRAPDASYAAHAECIVNTLRCIGVYLEQDNCFKLDQLLMIFRKVLLSDAVRVSSVCKKNLMEAIECKASNWIFSPNQQVSRNMTAGCRS